MKERVSTSEMSKRKKNWKQMSGRLMGERETMRSERAPLSRQINRISDTQ